MRYQKLILTGLVFLSGFAHAEPGKLTPLNPIEIVTRESLGVRKVLLTAPSGRYRQETSFLQFASEDAMESFFNRFVTPPRQGDDRVDDSGKCVTISEEKFCAGDRLNYGDIHATLVDAVPARLTEQGRKLVSLDERGGHLLLFLDDKDGFLMTNANDYLPLKRFLSTGELEYVGGDCPAERRFGFVQTEKSKECARKDALIKAAQLCAAAGLTLDPGSIKVVTPPMMSSGEAFHESFSTEIKAKCHTSKQPPASSEQVSVKRGERCPSGYYRSVEDLTYSSECFPQSTQQSLTVSTKTDPNSSTFVK